MSRIPLLEPRQPFLKSGVPAPTKLGETVQCPGRQPWHCPSTGAARESALARRGLEQSFGSRLQPDVGRIGAPLDRRQQSPAGPRVGLPQRLVTRPRTVRMEIRNQRGHRLGGIRPTAGTDDGRAFGWSSHQLQQHPPVEIRTSWIEQPGKRVATQRFPGVGAGGQLDATRTAKLKGVP
jgi:hypothetical protein